MSRPSEHPYLDIIIGNAERVEQLEAENARLRAAGDLLAAYVVLNVPPTAMCFAAVERWREARRG